MIDLLGRYTDQLRWLAEYALLPAHLLAVGHWYTPAACVGCIALLAHAAVATHHLKTKHNPVEA